MGLLTGKTALITGAARGIGKAIAIKFASEGANIAFTDLVIDENGKATEAEISALGVKCKGYASNAADFAQSEEVVKQVKEEFGSVDILVNNAGITKDGLMLRMSEAQWDAVIGVNLKSAFNFIHACVPVMMRQRNGSIINMASVVGVHGNAGQANYAASKAGMIALAKSVAQEMGPKGVRDAVGPQGVHARIGEGDFQGGGGRGVAAVCGHEVFVKEPERLGGQRPRQGVRQGANGELHGVLLRWMGGECAGGPGHSIRGHSSAS